jgi:hypothetical protein
MLEDNDAMPVDGQLHNRDYQPSEHRDSAPQEDAP